VKAGGAMAREIEDICAAKLREIRRSRGLTLQGFEVLSKGAVKAVVLGSYERGTRAISLERLEQLAELYEVPIQYFFGIGSGKKVEYQRGFIFDLRRIRKRSDLPPHLDAVKRYISWVAQMRSDWNGELISLRRSDSDCLTILGSIELSELTSELKLNGFLFAPEVSEQRSL
jgi:transcriptional regulator with XRE-family HTH domain